MNQTVVWWKTLPCLLDVIRNDRDVAKIQRRVNLIHEIQRRRPGVSELPSLTKPLPETTVLA